MIKEFECTEPSHEPLVFEKRFSSYSKYEEEFLLEAIYCPECGTGQHIKPIISQTGKPQFRGSGFHSTDYK